MHEDVFSVLPGLTKFLVSEDRGIIKNRIFSKLVFNYLGDYGIIEKNWGNLVCPNDLFPDLFLERPLKTRIGEKRWI